MKWEDFTLLMRATSGKDDLGNDIITYPEGATITGRATGWTADEVAIEPRELTESTRKIITPATVGVIKNAKKIRKDGLDYDIVQMRTNGKFQTIVVRGFRTI